MQLSDYIANTAQRIRDAYFTYTPFSLLQITTMLNGVADKAREGYVVQGWIDDAHAARRRAEDELAEVKDKLVNLTQINIGRCGIPLYMTADEVRKAVTARAEFAKRVQELEADGKLERDTIAQLYRWLNAGATISKRTDPGFDGKFFLAKDGIPVSGVRFDYDAGRALQELETSRKALADEVALLKSSRERLQKQVQELEDALAQAKRDNFSMAVKAVSLKNELALTKAAGGDPVLQRTQAQAIEQLTRDKEYYRGLVEERNRVIAGQRKRIEELALNVDDLTKYGRIFYGPRSPLCPRG